MTDEESFQSTLQEVKEIYLFLTEGEPSPDDEIEAKGKLINQFNRLKNLSTTSEQKDIIEFILKNLEEWDTLDLWFSETSLPNEIKKILKIPESAKISEEEGPKDFEKPDVKPKSAETEVDLTDIFNMASEQFKGEIDNLKGKIDSLKKELEKKDESLKSMKRRKVHKIVPKTNVKLAPPKIKIPVLKTLVKPPLAKSQPTPKTIVSKEQPEPKLKPVEVNRVRERIEPAKENLTPIPITPKESVSKAEKQELTPLREKVPEFHPFAIEESDDIPIITEKRKITPIITEESSRTPPPEFSKSTPFLTEKPKISSVRIEEIERESIVSSGSDLFNVFSSMGDKGSSKQQEIISSTVKQVVVEEKKRDEKKKKKDEDFQESNLTPFINFNNESVSDEPDFSTPSIDSLSNDKDTLYQELIALEGKRYSLERSFKNLEKDYNKGSISELDFKNKNNNLKDQLNTITSRINKIRGLISTL